MVNAVSGEEYVHIDCDKLRCYDSNLLRYQKWGHYYIAKLGMGKVSIAGSRPIHFFPIHMELAKKKKKTTKLKTSPGGWCSKVGVKTTEGIGPMA